MKLILTVQIQTGGKQWSQCWQSIRENLDLFDNLFISINYTDTQKEDAALVENFASEKVSLQLQSQYLDDISHLSALDQWLFHSVSSGHIFRLKDDAVLLRKGLTELRAAELSSSDAAIGSFKFIHAEKKLKPMIVREFRKSDGTFLEADQWGFLQYQQPFSLAFSGTVLSVSAAKENFFLRSLLKSSTRLPELHLCNPHTARIFQTWNPVVEVLYPSEPTDSNSLKNVLQHDEILSKCLIFALYKDHWTRLFISRQLLYSIQIDCIQGIKYFFKAQCALLRSGRKLSAILPLYLYIGKIFRTKVINILKKGGTA